DRHTVCGYGVSKLFAGVGFRGGVSRLVGAGVVVSVCALGVAGTVQATSDVSPDPASPDVSLRVDCDDYGFAVTVRNETGYKLKLAWSTYSNVSSPNIGTALSPYGEMTVTGNAIFSRWCEPLPIDFKFVSYEFPFPARVMNYEVRGLPIEKTV